MASARSKMGRELTELDGDLDENCAEFCHGKIRGTYGDMVISPFIIRGLR